jgi:putative tricarboxylic transport membrane protein
MFDQKTLFMLTLGLLIIPHSYQKLNLTNLVRDASVPVVKYFPWLTSIGASIVGFIAGLIPGPSAYTASYAAYHMGKDPHTKIIAAETANNSAVISTGLFMILTAIPINQNTLLLLAALELNQVDITQAIWNVGSTGLTILNELLLAIVISSIIYYFLSVNFIKYYVKVIEFFHDKSKIFLTILLIVMCIIDINTSDSNIMSYLSLTSFFIGAGLILHYFKISPLPLLFAIIIGDRLVWSFIQVYHIYF